MKKHHLGLAAAGLALAALAAGSATRMSVQVRSTPLRERASFLGRPTTEVAYGAEVTILSAEGPWRQVRVPNVEAAGWIHESALTTKRLTMTSAEVERTGASAEEVSLAAKGFTEQVEHAYKKDNPAADFAWVDRMEKLKVTPEEAVAFLRQGGLAPREGGAR